MNNLPTANRAKILEMFCEDMSMHSVSRIKDESINKMAKLLVDAGEACAAGHDGKVPGVQSKRIPCDELRSFTYAKQKNALGAQSALGGAGDPWTWTALNTDSKLIVSWLVGDRDSQYAMSRMDDLRIRLATRVQLTTDGNEAYLEPAESALGMGAQYAQLVKLYGAEPQGPQTRYSPAQCNAARKDRIAGNADPQHV